MSNKTYEFDPCSLDGSDKEQKEIKIDDWKPREKSDELIQSEWRKKQIGSNFNQTPGLDDLKKINSCIKNKKSDYEIMRTFGINAKVLLAIKDKRYCPVEGMSLDNLSKINNEFEELGKKIDNITEKLKDYLDILVTKLLPKENLEKMYKEYIKQKKEANKKTKLEKRQLKQNKEKDAKNCQ